MSDNDITAKAKEIEVETEELPEYPYGVEQQTAHKHKRKKKENMEQISLFEALALNGAWSNAACTGYCLLAMQRAGLDKKTIEKVLHELHWAFDDTSVEQAEKIYCGGKE